MQQTKACTSRGPSSGFLLRLQRHSHQRGTSFSVKRAQDVLSGTSRTTHARDYNAKEDSYTLPCFSLPDDFKGRPLCCVIHRPKLVLPARQNDGELVRRN